MKNLPLLRKGCQPRTIGKGLAGFRLGLRSAARLGLAPLGALAATCHRQLCSTQRLDRGLVLILPGIEGCSTVNDGIAAGLAAAGCDLAVRIEDWRRFRPWNPMHLMLHQHNRLQARRIAALLSNYSHQYPGRPVHLIGHSAGAGMALFILEALADPVQIENVLLLAAAVSRKYPLNKAASRVRGKIWNFFSPLDMPTTGLGTAVFGTMDRRHSVSAGCLGFSSHPQSPPQLQQVCFQPQMVRQWNLGGHFGWTNSLFVRNQLAPLLKIHQQPGWMNSTDFGRDSNERHAERKNPRPHTVPE